MISLFSAIFALFSVAVLYAPTAVCANTSHAFAGTQARGDLNMDVAQTSIGDLSTIASATAPSAFSYASADVASGILRVRDLTSANASQNGSAYATIVDTVFASDSMWSFDYLDWSIEGQMTLAKDRLYDPFRPFNKVTFIDINYAIISQDYSYQRQGFTRAITPDCPLSWAYGCVIQGSGAFSQWGTIVIPTNMWVTIKISLETYAAAGDDVNALNTGHLFLRGSTNSSVLSDSGVFLATAAPVVPEPATTYLLLQGLVLTLMLCRYPIAGALNRRHTPSLAPH